MTTFNQGCVAAMVGLVLTYSVAASATNLSLDQSLLLAQQYSAELSANHYQANALNNMADSAMQLPDPQLSIGVENVPVGGNNAHRFTREGMTMQRIGIMQRYVSYEKRERKAKTLRTQSQQVAQTSRVIITKLQTQTAQSWLDLALSKKALKQTQALVKETQQQLAIEADEIASGKSSNSALLDQQLALVSMQNLVTNAQRDVGIAKSQLTQLTGEQVDNIQGELPDIDSLPAEKSVLFNQIMQHPEVMQAKEATDVAKSQAAQSAIAAIPDVGVQLYYAKRNDDNDDMAGIMLTFDLPFFKSQHQDKDYAADISRSKGSVDQLSLLIRAHRQQLESLLSQYDAAKTILTRWIKTIIPLQQQRLNLMIAQYQTGKGELSSVLNARLALLNAKLSAINAEKEVAKNWASLRYLIPQEN